ncbi:hypothetical protein K493DRAFT_410036 [Basidiobolus meristosporus CBS 931.73]|uniref:Uncharacterized protein n=1 Tax=Basidiobolus meristosporus CBS 931.73 TaxID=1314790 RepID=A0A1Y1XWR4_9FUNG|nr:hypothetical protein K493DRAFT_410036 [Basidiobolus meristosporus CBS 931.73]|eukprot:ORX90173.1 hypothetical protein K493DRAFT_410036 [Basidiobolus meristosporus CBS 931.73]
MKRAVRRKVSYILNQGNGAPGGILYSAGRDVLDGEYLVGADHTQTQAESAAWEIDPTTGAVPKSTFRQSSQHHTDWVNDIVLCHQGQSLISASADRTLKLWSPHSSVPNVTTVGYHSDYIKVLAHGPSTNWIASGGLDRKIHIWDIDEGRSGSDGSYAPIVTLPEASPIASVYALACNRYGSILASGSPEKVVRVWDPRSGKKITKLTGHTDNIRALLISDDGQLLLSASSDSTIKLWSLSAQRCINTYTTHSDSTYVGSRGSDSDGNDGECVAICKEKHGVVKLVAVDNKYIWTATASSSINRWRDTTLPSGKSMSSSLYLPPSSPVPASSMIRMAVPESPSRDEHLELLLGERKGRPTSFLSLNYSVVDDPLVPEIVVPMRTEPDETIEGKHGLIKHAMLNNRRHVLTLDTDGVVDLWDIIQCKKLKTLGKANLDELVSEMNTQESVATWCSIDTRIGALTVCLDERRCFDGEVYLDELDLPEEENPSEDQRVNLGKWVLRNLFANYTETRPLQSLPLSQNGYAPAFPSTTPDHFQPGHSLPPTRTPTPSNGNYGLGMTSLTHNIEDQHKSSNEELPPMMAPKPMLPLATTPAAATTPHSVSLIPSLNSNGGDYFSYGSPPNSSVNPPLHTAPATLASNDYFSTPSTGTTSTVGPVPIPTRPQPAVLTGPSSSFMGRLKSFSYKKLSRTPGNEPKNDLEQSEHVSNNQPVGGTTVSSQLPPSSPTNTHPAQPTLNPPGMPKKEESSHREEEFARHSEREETAIAQETPPLSIPSDTNIIISEETHEASTSVDIYHGTVGNLGVDYHYIDDVAPIWLLEFLFKGRIPVKEPVKLSFVLKPHENSGLSELPNGNSRLIANRMLRVRKLLSYIVEKLELDQPATSPYGKAYGSSSNGVDSTIKPEQWIELCCHDQVLPPTITLATIRAFIWRLGGDVLITYRYKINLDPHPSPTPNQFNLTTRLLGVKFID